MRALKHLEKSQLQLVRLHAVHVVEGAYEALQVLERKPRDQIQMPVRIVKPLYLRHRVPKPVQVRSPADGGKRLRIGGLHADLQLDEAEAHVPDQRQHLPVQQIRRYLEMKIGHAVVVL